MPGMKIYFLLTCLAISAVTAFSGHQRRKDLLLEVSSQGRINNQLNKLEMEMEMLRACNTPCINSVLQEAKNFHANALKTGDCMQTNNEGDSVPYVDGTGSVILTEAECDREDGDWIENLRGGPVDILKNAYTAFRAKDGGAIKMFFTVITQGFYMVKDRLLTTLGMHSRIREAWMLLTQSASEGLGTYPLRTEKRSLFDKARIKIQELLENPIQSVCGVLPSLSVSFVVGTEISLASLCSSALKSLVNNYLGWLKRQIKNMIRKIYEAKGAPELGKKITSILIAPLGFVFTSFEKDIMNGMDAGFRNIFQSVKDILRDLQVSKVNLRNRAIEETAVGYCWDTMNKEMFTGDDKEKLAEEQYAKDVQAIFYRTKPMVDGLDEAVEEHMELLNGYTQDKKIEHKLERLVYVASLVFDPRVANVWSSDMLDALITSVMVRFSTAMASSKKLQKMENAADKAKEHLQSNGLTTRARFAAAVRAVENEKNLTMEEIIANHEQSVEELKHQCWQDVKGARCYSLHHRLQEAKKRMPKSWWGKSDDQEIAKADSMAVAVADKENATDSGKKKKKRSWFWSSKDKEDGSFIEVNRRWGSKSKDKSDSADKPKRKGWLWNNKSDKGKKDKLEDSGTEESTEPQVQEAKNKPEDSGTEESTEPQVQAAKNAMAEKKEENKDSDGEKAVLEKPSKGNDNKKKTSSSWFSWSTSSNTDISDVVNSLKEELRKHNCPSEREMLSSRFNRDSFLQLDEDKERSFSL